MPRRFAERAARPRDGIISCSRSRPWLSSSSEPRHTSIPRASFIRSPECASAGEERADGGGDGPERGRGFQAEAFGGDVQVMGGPSVDVEVLDSAVAEAEHE